MNHESVYSQACKLYNIHAKLIGDRHQSFLIISRSVIEKVIIDFGIYLTCIAVINCLLDSSFIVFVGGNACCFIVVTKSFLMTFKIALIYAGDIALRRNISDIGVQISIS